MLISLDRGSVSIVLLPSTGFFHVKRYLQNLLLIIMLQTKIQLENMSNEELIDEVLSLSFKL